MSNVIASLLNISSACIDKSLSSNLAFEKSSVLMTKLGHELMSLLGQRNGFFAFESALLIRPLSFSGMPLGIMQWNHEPLWRKNYDMDLSGVLFFAEDIFGSQFCICPDGINSFDPETGAFVFMAKSVESWAKCIMDDYRVVTGWPLAHEWQLQYGPIEPGQRLLPKTPFVLGGKFELGNLFKLNDVDGMRFRASIAVQIRNCPDGSTVVLKALP